MCDKCARQEERRARQVLEARLDVIRRTAEQGREPCAAPDRAPGTPDHEATVALTGVTDTDSEKLAHDRWDAMVAALKKAGPTLGHAQQRLNREVVDAVEGRGEAHRA